MAKPCIFSAKASCSLGDAPVGELPGVGPASAWQCYGGSGQKQQQLRFLSVPEATHRNSWWQWFHSTSRAAPRAIGQSHRWTMMSLVQTIIIITAQFALLLSQSEAWAFSRISGCGTERDIFWITFACDSPSVASCKCDAWTGSSHSGGHCSIELLEMDGLVRTLLNVTSCLSSPCIIPPSGFIMVYHALSQAITSHFFLETYVATEIHDFRCDMALRCNELDCSTNIAARSWGHRWIISISWIKTLMVASRWMTPGRVQGRRS